MREPIHHCEHNLSLNMERVIKCIECGKETTVGESYCSRVHFYLNGVWALNVCKECHKKEVKEGEEK